MAEMFAFDQESIVYGCIKDYVDDTSSGLRHRTNREAILTLPSSDAWPYLSQDMFSMPQTSHLDETTYMTQIMHFGASYKAVEYEWNEWLSKFETLLSKMYWASAVVHLETELTGTHTFVWTSSTGGHVPGNGSSDIHCEWLLEKDFA